MFFSHSSEDPSRFKRFIRAVSVFTVIYHVLPPREAPPTQPTCVDLFPTTIRLVIHQRLPSREVLETFEACVV